VGLDSKTLYIVAVELSAPNGGAPVAAPDSTGDSAVSQQGAAAHSRWQKRRALAERKRAASAARWSVRQHSSTAAPPPSVPADPAHTPLPDSVHHMPAAAPSVPADPAHSPLPDHVHHAPDALNLSMPDCTPSSTMTPLPAAGVPPPLALMLRPPPPPSSSAGPSAQPAAQLPVLESGARGGRKALMPPVPPRVHHPPFAPADGRASDALQPVVPPMSARRGLLQLGSDPTVTPVALVGVSSPMPLQAAAASTSAHLTSPAKNRC